MKTAKPKTFRKENFRTNLVVDWVKLEILLVLCDGYYQLEKALTCVDFPDFDVAASALEP